MTEQSSAHRHRQATALLVLTMALWAGNHVIGRWAGQGHVPPMTLAFLRWLGAAALILPFAIPSLKADWPVIRDNWGRLLILGVLGSGAYNTLQYIALTQTTVTSAAILNSWAPIMIAVAGAAFFGDRLGARQATGLAISLAGVLTIVAKGHPGTLLTLAFNAGDLIMLFATVIWAAYTALLRTRPAMSTLSFAALTYAIAAILNLPLAGYEYATGQYMEYSANALLAVGYTAVLASLAAYFFYADAVEQLGATRTGAFIHLIPLFASVMAIILLGERPALFHFIGFAAILTGVFLASRPTASGSEKGRPVEERPQ